MSGRAQSLHLTAPLISSTDRPRVEVPSDTAIRFFGRAARSGIYRYPGAMHGRPDLEWINIYRPAEEVFAPASLATFRKRPVTIDHPPASARVSPESWSHVVRGYVERAWRDREFVAVSLAITHSEAVKAIMSGDAAELSVSCLWDEIGGHGIAPDGTPYEARMTNIRVDHVALVPVGHAGPECRVLI